MKAALAVVFAATVILLMLWLAGTFHRKIEAGTTLAEEHPPAGWPVGDVSLVAAQLIEVPRVESAVGTIRAVHETAVASKLLAKVVAVKVTAGQKIEAGDVLIRLDDADLTARLEQAQAAAEAARAARDQAQIEYDRVKRLREQNAASQIEWDRAQTALRTAKAELEQARQAVQEAKTVLGYATITAPISGIVIDKKVEVGDTVTPGQPVVSLYDPERMQLVASVRESLTRRLEVGQDVDVRIEAIEKTCTGRISEIVPEAEAASRTFSVKVTGPCPPGIYSGMFGRLLIPLDAEEVLVIPRSAVRRIGQLDIVEVAISGRLHRRAVQLGRVFGDRVEVLSGVRAGEEVAEQSARAGGEETQG